VSLRWKLTMALAVVAAAATFVVGLSSYRATSDRLMEEIDASLRQAERLLISDRDGGFRNPREPRGDGPIVRIPVRPLGVEQYVVQVLDPSGAPTNATEGVRLPVNDSERVLAATGKGSSMRSADGTIDDETVSFRISTTGVEGGAVQVARDLGETERVLADLRTRTAWLAVIVAAIGALVGWLVSSGVTRSLTRLTQAAGEVASTGRLDVPVPVSGRDEAGRLGTAFNTMLAALQTSKEQQQRLVQDAGHELRTPLTSLRTNIDVLRKHDQMAPDMKAQVLDDLDREAGQLAALVEEVVELATDRREEEPVSRVELAALAESAAERLTRRTGRLVRLDVDASALDGRPAALERAISNLLDNAAKFDPSDLPIELTVRDGVVEVRDHGPGIADTDLPHVWERFHRADTARPLPGSGLGLSIVAAVVAAHGGSVTARNHPDGGAVVGFSLPV
jgi:two-component system sensor histidine kinase MprB